MTIIQVSKDLFPFVHCPENCQREILDMFELSIDEKCHLKYWQGKGYTSLGKLETFSSKCHTRIFCLIISQRRKHIWCLTMEMFAIYYSTWSSKNVNCSKDYFAASCSTWYSVQFGSTMYLKFNLTWCWHCKTSVKCFHLKNEEA